MRRGGVVLFALVVLSGCSDQSSAPTGASPDLTTDVARGSAGDLVATPAGWYHRSCVHEVPNGARVTKDRVVIRPNGTSYQLPACAHPRPQSQRAKPGSDAAVTWPENNSYIEKAWKGPAAGVIYRKVSANWTVPSNPTGAYSGTQIYYNFSGLFNSVYILQPVLQYGYNGQYGGSYWTLTSWRCDDGDNCTHSPPVTVNAGEAVNGSVVASNCAGGNCTWTVTNTRVSTGQSTVHVVPDNDNYANAMGGAVEVYHLTACNQYPTNGVYSTGIALYNGSMTRVYPAWTKTVTSGLSPFCTFSINSPSTDIVRLYHNIAPAPTVTTLTTNPSPARQYVGFTVTITGSGFNPANVEAVITGGTAPSSCSTTTPCYIRNNQFTTKTSTLLVATYSLSIPSSYLLSVRNGDGGTQGGSKPFTVVPF